MVLVVPFSITQREYATHKLPTIFESTRTKGTWQSTTSKKQCARAKVRKVVQILSLHDPFLQVYFDFIF
jgi:hypothetical protein